MSYAFTFDASACTGCKACQEACKDKNGLPAGVLWRWVVEVAGGEWQARGAAWEHSVFAYNLSLACNHCVHPKCAGVCPVDAFTVRPDGIVLLDSTRCMGCGYCAWACPYGAPQYDPAQGVMAKCNFCFDNLDEGLPPSCVAACPLRALDFHAVGVDNPMPGRQALWLLPASAHPFPLPPYSRTEPHLSLKPHPAMGSPLSKQVANREEVQPRITGQRGRLAAYEELPLVGFTLLSGMAAGIAACLPALASIPFSLLLSIGLLLGAGGLSAFLHLGRKRNAWRAVVHQKKSWLSREVLAAGLLWAVWALAVLSAPLRTAAFTPWLLALLGLGLVFSMGQVYRLRAVPAWNTWRTPAAFLLSAAVLGALGVNLAVPEARWAAIAGAALALELALTRREKSPLAAWARRLRLALLGAALLGAVLIVLGVGLAPGAELAPLVFAIALAQEALGRWGFYAARQAGGGGRALSTDYADCADGAEKSGATKQL